MSYSDNNITVFGTCGLNIVSITPTKIAATVKQTLGKVMAKHGIPGRSALDIRLELRGIMYGTASETKDEQRAKLISLQNGTKHHYSDGEHIASMAIENDGLVFDDAGEKVHNHYTYSISLIQWEGE